MTISVLELRFLESSLPEEANALLDFTEPTTATELKNLAELINLTFNTHCYSVACNFFDFDERGRRLHLNEHTTMPVDKKMNFSHYALDILVQKPLAATPYGLVFEQSPTPSQTM